MDFTHIDKNGNAIMVDISGKDITDRVAVASGYIKLNEEIISSIKNISNKKGDVLSVARIAGIMAVKNTSSAIPLCHTLLINKCTVDFKIDEQKNISKLIKQRKI